METKRGHGQQLPCRRLFSLLHQSSTESVTSLSVGGRGNIGVRKSSNPDTNESSEVSLFQGLNSMQELFLDKEKVSLFFISGVSLERDISFHGAQATMFGTNSYVYIAMIEPYSLRRAVLCGAAGVLGGGAGGVACLGGGGARGGSTSEWRGWREPCGRCQEGRRWRQ